MASPQRLVWERDGRHWPHRDASRFVQAAGLSWHVQRFSPAKSDEAAQLPVALLIHGTGASTHSWRGLAPLLAQGFDVLSLDLPGHGFTSMPAAGHASPQFSPAGMASAIAAVLQTLGLKPDLVLGHSAGAAVAVRMCIDQQIAPRLLLGINAALLPLGGLPGQFFSPVAKLMTSLPFVPQAFAARAGRPDVLQKLIDGTGSRLDATGIELYRQLAGNPGHVAGALAMMANWNLHVVAADLPRLQTPVVWVVGAEDRTIAPAQANQVMARARSAPSHLNVLPGLGHLAHEERPELIAAIVAEKFPPSV